MSCFVTRPAKPLPGMREMSTLCSAAILRTRGVDLVRRRCSAVWTPPPSPLLRGAGGAGVGLGSAFGGGGGAGAGADAVAPEAAGACWAAAEGAAADVTAPAPVSSTATSVCTGTVWPSCTFISANTPAAGAGISASTLSVEISNSGSSRFTASPTFLSHLLKVPSAIDSPICGINTSTRAIVAPSVRHQPAGGLHNIVSLREHEVFEGRRIRERHIMRRHPHDRSVEPLECLFVDPRRNLAGDPARARVFVDDQHFVRLLDARNNRGVIQRQQCAQVEHFHGQAVCFLELLGGLERFTQRRPVRDDGQVFPLARDAGLADRRENLLALRQLLLDPAVEPLVLQVEHRILVADRCLDETLRVPHGCRIDDLEAGRVEKRRFRVLRMERPAANVAATRAAHHHGGRQSGAIARGGDIVREHVVRARDEVDELHLRHGTQTHVRRTGRRADNGGLRDRRIDDTRFAELLREAIGDLEGAAVEPDVLAEDEDALVALHLLPQALAQRFEECDFGHQRVSGATRSPIRISTRTGRPRTRPGTKRAPCNISFAGATSIGCAVLSTRTPGSTRPSVSTTNSRVTLPLIPLLRRLSGYTSRIP